VLKIKINETVERRVILDSYCQKLSRGVTEFINSIKPFDKRQKKVSEFGTTMGTTDVSNRL